MGKVFFIAKVRKLFFLHLIWIEIQDDSNISKVGIETQHPYIRR